MRSQLVVSISSIFDETRPYAERLIGDLERLDIPVSLLLAPHIDGSWHLAKDAETAAWLTELKEAGTPVILNGFDKAVQGRRAEFANLGAHEARLRLKGATRQMAGLGFGTDMFAPPRWRLSPGTLEVLPEFGFRLAISTTGLHHLDSGSFTRGRNFSIGEGYGAAKWWRRNLIRAVARRARKGGLVRLSASARNLESGKVTGDLVTAALAAQDAGALPTTYRELAASSGSASPADRAVTKVPRTPGLG